MNTFGNKFRISIFGESHGECIGAVIDGVPAGISLTKEDFTTDIDRRRSGAKGTTPRREADEPEIVSGVYEGRTTGAPLTILFRNGNTRPTDYENLRNIPRPGHADYVASLKWNGFNDPRGGGHFSGRLTLPLVAAGVIAKKILPKMTISAALVEVGGIKINEPFGQNGTNPKSADSQTENTAGTAETDAGTNAGMTAAKDCQNTQLPKEVTERLEAAIRDGDSLGGVVECRVENVPAGLGEPFFNSVESLISHAVFSIPGVRGIEFGDGFAAARMTGSQHNDPLGPACAGSQHDNPLGTVPAGMTGLPQNNPLGPDAGPSGSNVYNVNSKDSDCAGEPRLNAVPLKNGAGGVNGGITNGAPIVFRVAFKPTSSISKPQTTFNLETGGMTELRVGGRHDVCFALRTPVIVEAAAAIVLADLLA